MFSALFASILSPQLLQRKITPLCKGQWSGIEEIEITVSLWELMEQCSLAMEINCYASKQCYFLGNFPGISMGYKVQMLQDQLDHRRIVQMFWLCACVALVAALISLLTYRT